MYQHRRHNKNLLMVHIILVTKYRKKLFVRSFKDDIKQCVYDICKEHHWYVKRMETDKDHMHILLQYNPTDNITKVVSVIKQYSTYLMWKRYHDHLSVHYWKNNTLWSRGYFAASVGQVSQTTIERYIANQG